MQAYVALCPEPDAHEQDVSPSEPESGSVGEKEPVIRNCRVKMQHFRYKK